MLFNFFKKGMKPLCAKVGVSGNKVTVCNSMGVNILGLVQV